MKPKIKISPTVFDTVFVRRIRGQPDDLKTIKIGDFLKDRLSVPRGIVHENDAVQIQQRTEIPLEPDLKPNVFGSPIVYNGSNHFIVTLSGYDVQTFFSLARSFHKHPFSSWSAGSFTNDMTLHSTFVNVDKRSIARKFSYLNFKCTSFLFVAFSIGY